VTDASALPPRNPITAATGGAATQTTTSEAIVRQCTPADAADSRSDDGTDQDLDRRGRDANAVVERSDAERNRDDHDPTEPGGRGDDQLVANCRRDLAARRRGAEQREWRHQPEGNTRAHRAEGIRHAHARPGVVRTDRPREGERQRDQDRGHSTVRNTTALDRARKRSCDAAHDDAVTAAGR